MGGNEVVITYKRKRFSARVDLVHGSNASKSPARTSPRRSGPKVELDNHDEKLIKDFSPCFKCGNFDVDENLLRCGCCSETHHFHCMDAPQKRKWQCPICHRRNDSEGSQHYDIGESRRGRKSKRIVETEMGVTVGSPSRKSSCSTADSPLLTAVDSTRMDCTDNTSCPSSKFTGLDGAKPDPVQLASSAEIKYSGSPKDSTVTLNLDKTNKWSKEKCKVPLITFSRRAKRKREGTGKGALWNSESEEKLCPSTTVKDPESNCNLEDSSALFSTGDHPAGAVRLLERTKVANVEKDARLKSLGAEDLRENKIIQEGNISDQNPVHVQPATNVRCSADEANFIMESAANDFFKHSISIKDDKQSSTKIVSPVREEFRNELRDDKQSATMILERTDLSHDHGLSPCELAISAARPACTCMSNIESSKPSVDVVAENLMESQSSSTPNCPIALANEETDGRDKELQWLEDLDRVLQNKKNRDTCSPMEHTGANCARVSDGRASPTVLANSSIQSTCDKAASPQYVNQVTPLEGRVFLQKLGDIACEKQQHDEVSTRSSLYTDFLGMSLPPNHGSHVGSVKDVQGMLLPSSSGVKDNNAHALNRHLLWHRSSETSFLLKHKQVVENGISGRRMLKERQCSTANVFRRYLNEWSEEELDCLWIGVRRHGTNNWNAMLRDPKLHFSETRVAEDLAMQWDIEQRKLLNGTLMHPFRFHRADYPSSSVMNDALLSRSTAADQYASSVWSHASSEFPTLTAETRLSLGDVYHRNRNLFQPSGMGIASQLKSENSSTSSLLSSLSVASMVHRAGVRQHMPIRAQNTRYDWGPSRSQRPGEQIVREQQSSGPPPMTASSALPHWLKEVIIDRDPRPRGSSLPPVVSGTAHSIGLLNEDMRRNMPFPCNEPSAPPKSTRRRGILKRKNTGYGNMTAGCRSNELPSSLNEPQKAGVLSSLGNAPQDSTLDATIAAKNNSVLNQNLNSSGPLRPSDLAVINSDASSEETISDDQSSRPS